MPPRPDPGPDPAPDSPASDPFDARGMPHGAVVIEGWEIGPREAKRRLDADPEVIVLDVRTDQERRISSIPGSLHVPLHDLPVRLQGLREHEERSIIVHCEHGKRSFQATEYLRREGFTDVVSMAGGLDLWRRAVGNRD